MNIDFCNVIKHNVPSEVQMPSRAQIFVGLKCSQKCGFCFYGHCNAKEMFAPQYVLKQIDLELQAGTKDFEFIGGEPGECDNLAEYCLYIKRKSPSSKISVITNGSLSRLQEVWPLIDEVLISYHLSKEAVDYDKKFFPNGHTYEKMAACAKLAKENNVLLKYNILVGNFNLLDVFAVCKDVVEFKPEIINFLTLDIMSDAADLGETYVDMSLARPILKQCIDYIREKLPQTLVFIKFIPFCDMEGYEDTVVGKYQLAFDWFDWNRQVDGEEILQILKQPEDQLIDKILEFKKHRIEILSAQLKNDYKKPDECLGCKYMVICQGLNADDNINKPVPAPGEVLRNPMQFIKTATQDVYKNV